MVPGPSTHDIVGYGGVRLYGYSLAPNIHWWWWAGALPPGWVEGLAAEQCWKDLELKAVNSTNSRL